ncbi:hypothetical protein CRE_00452 [Caenorhabditis remanei]|uniref:Uncharacterized protein n=1 Tax=Caenorhabditis remanei TaxID=31234 RepID=E3LCR7_CAERE|nr:hypothetical protein CRE_00452 [Caenorhabditis remanei]
MNAARPQVNQPNYRHLAQFPETHARTYIYHMHWKSFKNRESGQPDASLKNLEKAERKINATNYLTEEETDDLNRLANAIRGEWGDVRQPGGLWDQIQTQRDHYEKCWLQFMSKTNREDMKFNPNKTFSEYLEKVEKYLEREHEIRQVQSRSPPSLHIPGMVNHHGSFFPSVGQTFGRVPYHAPYHVPGQMFYTPNNFPPGYHQYYSERPVFPNGNSYVHPNYVGNQMHYHNHVVNVSAPPTQVVQPSFSTGINVHDKETDVQNTMGNLSIVDEANTSLEECKPRSSNGGQHIALHCPVTVNVSAPPSQDVQMSETCDDSVCEQEKEDCHIGQSETLSAPTAQNVQKSTGNLLETFTDSVHEEEKKDSHIGQSQETRAPIPENLFQTDSPLEEQMPSTPIRAIVQSSNRTRSRASASKRRSAGLGGYKNYINRPKIQLSKISTVSENERKNESGSDTAQNAALCLLTDWRKSPEMTSPENRGPDIAALLQEYLKFAVGSVGFEETETEDILRFEESMVQILQIYKDSGVDLLADFAKRNKPV